MCRVGDGYFRSIHEPGTFDVYLRNDGHYIYMPSRLRNSFNHRLMYRINVKAKRPPVPKYEQGNYGRRPL